MYVYIRYQICGSHVCLPKSPQKSSMCAVSFLESQWQSHPFPKTPLKRLLMQRESKLSSKNLHALPLPKTPYGGVKKNNNQGILFNLKLPISPLQKKQSPFSTPCTPQKILLIPQFRFPKQLHVMQRDMKYYLKIQLKLKKKS